MVPEIAIVVLESIGSTQDELVRRIKEGAGYPLVIRAREQTAGRGRFGRNWQTKKDEALAMSMALPHLVGHPKPHLIGMLAALICAEQFDLSLRWPNDLILNGKKVGGVLTELVEGHDHQLIPVVGIGINLAQTSFPPELSPIATSIFVERRVNIRPDQAARMVVEAIRDAATPFEFAHICERWLNRDVTPGKFYKLPTGEIGEAMSMGLEGELLCKVDDETRIVLAAEAWFGPK